VHAADAAARPQSFAFPAPLSAAAAFFFAVPSAAAAFSAAAAACFARVQNSA